MTTRNLFKDGFTAEDFFTANPQDLATGPRNALLTPGQARDIANALLQAAISEGVRVYLTKDSDGFISAQTVILEGIDTHKAILIAVEKIGEP